MLPAGHGELDILVAGSAYRDDLNALTGSLNDHPTELALWGVDPETNQTTATVYTTLEESGSRIVPMEAGQSAPNRRGHPIGRTLDGLSAARSYG